jgi:hypothetical protein
MAIGVDDDIPDWSAGEIADDRALMPGSVDDKIFKGQTSAHHRVQTSMLGRHMVIGQAATTRTPAPRSTPSSNYKDGDSFSIGTSLPKYKYLLKNIVPEPARLSQTIGKNRLICRMD